MFKRLKSQNASIHSRGRHFINSKNFLLILLLLLPIRWRDQAEHLADGAELLGLEDTFHRKCRQRLAKRVVLALQNREVALDRRGVCEGRRQATAERPEMNEGFGEQITPGVVEHCLVRVAIDARLERR